jgi:hypothetical protein
MNYKELAATDKAPFPFPQDANGAYPFETLPEGVLNPNPAFQGYFILCLKEVQKTHPDATISIDSGIAAITAGDKTVELTNALQHGYASGAQTIEQQMNRALGIVPPAPPAPTPSPAPIHQYGVPFVDIDGKTYEWQEWPFGDLKVRVKAVDSAVSGVASERAAFSGYLKGRLLETAEPIAQAELISALTWLSKRPS